MKKTITKRLRPAIVAAMAAGGLAATTQAADVIAYWDFEKIEADGIHIKAAQGPYEGEILGEATLTADGRPGGGKAFSVGLDTPGKLFLDATEDANPMNKAAVDDQVSVVFWQKNNSNLSASAFWFESESSNNGNRGFQAHVPWGSGDVYFDTQGCCTAPTQRINISANSVFPDHDFLEWHHYAFVKNGGAKTVYIDGEVLMNQDEGADPLTLDYYRINIGGAQAAGGIQDSIMDDFAIFKGALSQDEIKAIVGGAPIGVPPVDTDKDGMPDNWEIQYGFNPNDPADATLDADGDGANNLKEFQDGTNPTDTTKPVLNSAAATATFNTVIVTFSENLDPVSAVNVANYSITPSLAVTAATVKKNVVTLTTAAQTPGATAYTLKVNNVLDTSKNAVLADSSAIFYSYLNVRDGVLKISTYEAIGGAAIQGLYDDPRYPASPDRVGAVFSLNSRDFLPTDSLENYGATIEGYLTPAETGSYHFFDRSDDASELYISTDSTEAGLTLQAQETGCCAAFQEPDLGAEETTAAPLSLVAGTKYFIRLVYKEGGGGDYGQVAWRKVGDTTPAASLTPIPSQFLSSAVDLPAPPQGAILTQIPAPKAKNVSPATAISFSHRDGKTAWTDANVSMTFDGAAVTPTFTKTGSVLSLRYVPPALLTSATEHTVAVNYLDAGGNPAKEEWTFTVIAYSGPDLDKVASYPALITGAAVYTADKGGHSGAAGDYAMDHTSKGGSLLVPNAGWVNAASTKDELSVSLWIKKSDRADNSTFWFNSPTIGRALASHAPWSDNNIYWDTAGCCTADTQRIFANIDTFAGYTGDDGFWTNNWHHLVFTKKADVKEIWVDGQLFLSGSGANPLPADIDTLNIGGETPAAGLYHGKSDDFAVFSTQLVQADVTALFTGTAPTALPPAKGLIAFWDFNTTVVAVPTIAIAGSTITYTGTLQSSATLGGTFSPVAGATSPYTIPAGTEAQFYRTAQ